RLNSLYHQALTHGGEVSLGKGAALYKAMEKKLLGDLATRDQNQRYQLVESLCGLYRATQSHKITDPVADLKAFAFQRVPPILQEQVNNYDSIVESVAKTLYDVAGPRDGIAFILDRAESEPDWLRYTGQDAWSRHHHRLGEWRLVVKDLGDLEPRLLKFAIAELKRDLASRQSLNRSIYNQRHSHYWKEKADAFFAATEEVLAERKNMSSAVEHIAEYLFWSLPRETRAIEILFELHKQKGLSESGQAQLTDYLHRKDRHAEAIPLLLPLVEKRPGNFEYRRRLMHAYFRTGRRAELLALLKDTDAYFHQKDRWGEGNLAGLAASTLENKLFEQSAAYYEELIPMHQNAHPRRGVGNGVLSNYYSQAAQAYAGLGNTKKAVDMASGAVVSWGPTHGQRTNALESLVNVLAAAPDLAAFAADLDKEKLQSTVIRKSVGKAFIKKNDHARAVKHLLLAAELQPDDAETQRLLMSCFDAIGDGEKAVGQLLNAVETSRRDIKLFADLGSRYANLNRPGDAERAYTSVVEMLPNETESHTLLAEVREKQGRWRDAVAHWERVAALRSLEPTGLVKLAGAQIRVNDWDAAAATVKKLRGQSWPPRFNEVEKETRELERKLDARPKK
ncbi:MAG TPA: BTAD domain-containing putative transcriptional regulator, partial [Gemmataceae bacterium]|nr:BTAD domain-containing putative transcriptional regulator [Gemmataceae bacterium]